MCLLARFFTETKIVELFYFEHRKKKKKKKTTKVVCAFLFVDLNRERTKEKQQQQLSGLKNSLNCKAIDRIERFLYKGHKTASIARLLTDLKYFDIKDLKQPQLLDYWQNGKVLLQKPKRSLNYWEIML